MVTETPALHPEVLWAQRPDVLYVTVNVWDPQNEELQLSADRMTYRAQSGQDGKPYAVELEFHAPINPDESKYVKSGRGIAFALSKADQTAPYWPRLLSAASGKPHWLKTDFAKWKDEDELDEEPADDMFAGANPYASMGGPGAAGMPDFSSMMGGAGGMDFASMMGGAGAGGMPDFSSMMGGAGAGGMPDFSSMLQANPELQGLDIPDSDDEGQEGATEEGEGEEAKAEEQQ